MAPVLPRVSLTRKPTSRKYVSRKRAENERLGNMINYEGTASGLTVKQIYDWWWKANGGKG